MKYANGIKLLVEILRLLYTHRDLFIYFYMLFDKLKNDETDDTSSLIDSLNRDPAFLKLSISLNKELKKQIEHEKILSAVEYGT